MTLIQLFSFDVVGSAEFKSSGDLQDEAPSWLEPFYDFFEKTPLLFTAEIAQVFFHEDDDDFPEVPVWKAIGDELVFIARPRNTKEMLLLTQAFTQSMFKADEHFKSAWGLRIHGTTWSFEEGKRNRAIRFRELENNATTVMDLIGPDVDLGFRLVTHAPPGGVLATQEHVEKLASRALSVEMIGTAVLKGIQTEPYPLLQIKSQGI